jgi:hypothetical protein
MLASGVAAVAQERLPWSGRDSAQTAANETYPSGSTYGADDAYRPGDTYRSDDTYRPDTYRPDTYRKDSYAGGSRPYPPADDYDNYEPQESYRPSPRRDSFSDPDRGPSHGETYHPPRQAGEPYDRDYGDAPPPANRGSGGYYEQGEIVSAGHRFFGSISEGLASAVEYAFQSQGRPNGYILGEDAGGAIVLGLRYGEGRLYTKDTGTHPVYWQGPSVGYDAGAEGSKTMVLVYNLRDPSEIYHRFGGVQGAAYLVGGVSVQFQKSGDVMLAVIRSGVGLRLGANIGYLKYTRTPTWNPL